MAERLSHPEDQALEDVQRRCQPPLDLAREWLDKTSEQRATPLDFGEWASEISDLWDSGGVGLRVVS